MKGPIKNKQGFSLLEVVVSIAVLGLMVAPVCSSLVLSHRLNANSEEILQARLLVESTVEQLMAEGLVYEIEDGVPTIANIIPEDIELKNINAGDDELWYSITVESKVAPEVTVDTIVKAAKVYVDEPTPPAEEGGEGE